MLHTYARIFQNSLNSGFSSSGAQVTKLWVCTQVYTRVYTKKSNDQSNQSNQSSFRVSMPSDRAWEPPGPDPIVRCLAVGQHRTITPGPKELRSSKATQHSNGVMTPNLTMGRRNFCFNYTREFQGMGKDLDVRAQHAFGPTSPPPHVGSVYSWRLTVKRY